MSPALPAFHVCCFAESSGRPPGDTAAAHSPPTRKRAHTLRQTVQRRRRQPPALHAGPCATLPPQPRGLRAHSSQRFRGRLFTGHLSQAHSFLLPKRGLKGIGLQVKAVGHMGGQTLRDELLFYMEPLLLSVLPAWCPGQGTHGKDRPRNKRQGHGQTTGYVLVTCCVEVTACRVVTRCTMA